MAHTHESGWLILGEIRWLILREIQQIAIVSARLTYNFEFNTYEYGLLLIIIILTLKDIFGEFIEEVKFGGIELKTRIQMIEKDQRLYAIVGPQNQVVHSTFREQQFELIAFNPLELKIKFKMEPKPSYLEVRSNQGSIFAIEYKDGTYECTSDGYRSSEFNKIIVEAYFK